MIYFVFSHRNNLVNNCGVNMRDFLKQFTTIHTVYWYKSPLNDGLHNNKIIFTLMLLKHPDLWLLSVHIRQHSLFLVNESKA